MPPWLRRLLHSPFHQLAHSRHAPWQACGVRCIQLDDEARCRIFGQPERPAVCGGLQPCAEMCGPNKEQAMFYLTQLERLTQPQ